MPKHRSITMSVMSQWEMKQFPEFSHPDTTQYKPPGSIPQEDSFEPQRLASVSASSTSTGKADCRLDQDPTVSCYIPSIPGIRFFFKYTIEPPHPESQLFYFKLFMNGRHISSWGVNPRTNPRGQVLRGLFEPDGTWSISENSRTVLRHGGIESRPFLFTPEASDRCAADDGGLIEIRIFRASGRKRRAPSLEIFRPQEQYGIKYGSPRHLQERTCRDVEHKVLIRYSLPSAGLVDKPQDTRFYDYILVDPKDKPYAAFLFHYRSWEFLQSLQLIPPSHPRSLLKPSNSFAFLAGPSTEEGIQDYEDEESLNSNDDDDSWIAHQDPPPPVSHISQLRNSKVFYMEHGRSKHIGGHAEAFLSSSLCLEQRNTRAGIPTSVFSVPQTTLDEWAYERPLPKLPKAKSSFDHSRNSSTSSNAPSITPSLLPWFDRDSDNPSPEPIIGVAAAVPVLRSSPLSGDSVEDRSSYSSADWSIETPPQTLQLHGRTSNPLEIPPEALFFPQSVTVRKLRRKNSHSIFAEGRLVIEESDSEDNYSEDGVGGPSPPPSEAEWLRRKQGLSPIKRDSERSEVVLRRSLVSADTMDKSGSLARIREKHMVWAVNRNQNQQADESDIEDRESDDAVILDPATPCPNDKANHIRPEWI